MLFRHATSSEIPAMQVVRHSVKENILSNPLLVTDADVDDYINRRGKGWVCMIENKVVGFSIADLQEDNIWALFVLPEFEGKGIGTRLHCLMMDWYFSQQKTSVWLSTEAQSRAEAFYRKVGWKEDGLYGKNEIKFVMTAGDWYGKRPSFAGV